MADCQETRPLDGLKLLLADDAVVIRHLYSKALSRAGADVTTAENGEQAILLWKCAIRLGCPFEIVVLDYVMPGYDGGVVTATLRDTGFAGRIVGVSAE